MNETVHTRIAFTWRGRHIIAKLEIKPGHLGPATYTVFANRTSAIFLFRKVGGTWRSAYGYPPDDLAKAIIDELSTRYELDN